MAQARTLRRSCQRSLTDACRPMVEQREEPGAIVAVDVLGRGGASVLGREMKVERLGE